MKKTLLLSIILFSLSIIVVRSQSQQQAQIADFSGIKIYVNPGHGGHDSNDRHMLTTDFWESDGNLVKGLFLRQQLQNLNATVYMSRTTNTTEDDLSLSVIDEMANAANVDFFLSIHSNGFAGTQNEVLELFRGYDDAPVFASSKAMAIIMWQKIYEKGNCWTRSTQWVKGDWSFYPDWGDKVGLGVLRTLSMPAVLSEGSFHDYIPESWRLRNNDFLHHESWAFLRSFIQFYNVAPVNHGVIAGVVRDTLLTPSWYFKKGTRDEKQPLNGVQVTLTPGNKVYNVDNLNNGFFFFDSVSPGEYKLYFDGLADYYRDSLTVTVTANTSTLADMYLQYDTLKVPQLISLSPAMLTALPFNQEFTFTFDLPMNRDSVQKAVQFAPAATMTYTWDDSYKVLKVKPAVGLSSGTNYTLTLTTAACSKWKVKIASEKQYSFTTLTRSNLKIEKTFPTNGTTGVTLYPQIRVYFDAPINESSASTEIQLLNSLGQPMTKVREKFISLSGKGAYFFEINQALELNKAYTVSVGSGLTDVTGVTLGTTATYPFTTRTTNYGSGSVVEPYEVISNFWDPEASGSTVGTINSQTTFTASSEIRRAGSYSGQLDYVFSGTSGGTCRVHNTAKPSIGSDGSTYFGVWVFGDLSNNYLEYWFYSPGTVNQIVYVDDIDWAGWDFKTIPFNSIGGTGEMQFHSTVIQQSSTGSASGTIWFDNATVYVPTGINDHYADSLFVTLLPNPVTNQGTVRFTLRESSVVSLDVYGLDGRIVEKVSTMNLDPGVKEIPWTPSPELPDGIYLMRLTIRPQRSSSGVVVTRRCVLSR